MEKINPDDRILQTMMTEQEIASQYTEGDVFVNKVIKIVVLEERIFPATALMHFGDEDDINTKGLLDLEEEEWDEIMIEDKTVPVLLSKLKKFLKNIP